jgi:hypothetical protein
MTRCSPIFLLLSSLLLCNGAVFPSLGAVLLSPIPSSFAAADVQNVLSACSFDPRYGVPAAHSCGAWDCAVRFGEFMIHYWDLQQSVSFAQITQGFNESGVGHPPLRHLSAVTPCANGLNGCGIHWPFVAFLHICVATLEMISQTHWNSWAEPVLPIAPQAEPTLCDLIQVQPNGLSLPAPSVSCDATVLATPQEIAAVAKSSANNQSNVLGVEVLRSRVLASCYW